MDLAHLRERLESVDAADDPDVWAVHAYRFALAQSELATGADDLRAALELLERASHILTSARAPIEHARLVTAAGQCHRALGDPGKATALFAAAVALLEGRATPTELAAALVNLGLARGESGQVADALVALDRAVAELAEAAGDESRRLVGAAHLNRAQVHQLRPGGIDDAIVDYRAAIDQLDVESVQHGMAQHGLGTALLERHQAQADPQDLEAAHRAFDVARRTLTRESFPFQHAIATHSCAVAHQRSGGVDHLRLALARCELSMSLLDYRLHGAQWRTVAATASEIEAELEEAHPGMERADHFVALLCTPGEGADPRAILAERLTGLVGMPDARVVNELATLVQAGARAGAEDFGRFVRLLLGVLMELPEGVLAAAAEPLAAVRRVEGFDADRTLDSAIHDLLHGPQRVRVRDLLEAHGWERP